MIDKHELPDEEDIVLRAAVKAARELEGEQCLEADPPPPSPEAYERFRAKLTRCQRASRRKWLRVLIAAAALLALAATAAVALKLRSDALHLTPNDIYAEVHLDSAAPSSFDFSDMHQTYLITVPDGFEITDYQDAAGQHIITYRHAEKGNLYFYQAPLSTATNIDNELESWKPIAVGEHQGYFTTKDTVNLLCWSQDDILLSLETTALNRDELVALARSIVWHE